MPSVTLGNISPIAAITDPETGVKSRHRFINIEQSTCFINLAEEDLFDQMRDVINLWRDQSDQPPAWVDSDDSDLEDTLRKHFKCGGRPDDWEHVITGPPETAPIKTAPVALAPTPAVDVPPTPASTL